MFVPFSCAFGFGKDEVRVEIRIEGDRRAERLALPALEAAEDSPSFLPSANRSSPPSVSVFPAIWRNTGRAHSGLSQRTTLP